MRVQATKLVSHTLLSIALPLREDDIIGMPLLTVIASLVLCLALCDLASIPRRNVDGAGLSQTV